MKTTFLTLATIATLALGLGNTTYAAAKDSAAKTSNEVSTVLTHVSAINKIEVRGNVEVFISDGDADQVKVYNKYYQQTALVQSQNGVLRITSYADQKLVVWVKAADLRSITAFDNAQVKSYGKLSSIELNVSLHNNASASLNLDAYSASVTVADHATANLSGRADRFTLNHGVATSVNKSNFVADRTTDNHATATKTMEMAGL